MLQYRTSDACTPYGSRSRLIPPCLVDHPQAALPKLGTEHMATITVRRLALMTAVNMAGAVEAEMVQAAPGESAAASCDCLLGLKSSLVCAAVMLQSTLTASRNLQVHLDLKEAPMT